MVRMAKIHFVCVSVRSCTVMFYSSFTNLCSFLHLPDVVIHGVILWYVTDKMGNIPTACGKFIRKHSFKCTTSCVRNWDIIQRYCHQVRLLYSQGSEMKEFDAIISIYIPTTVWWHIYCVYTHIYVYTRCVYARCVYTYLLFVYIYIQ